VEADEAEPPRQPLAIERIVAVVQDRLAQQLAGALLRRPHELGRQAHVARVARRILHRLATPADLQREASFGGGRRHAERGAAARERRQVHLPRSQHRILPARLHQRHRHGDALARTTAPVHRHRSYVTMPKPETRPSFASGTARAPAAASSVSWRIASVMPRKPPAQPACPAESWPPLVLFGKSPSCVSVFARTNAGPSPFSQKPRSSNCSKTTTG